ncbi:YD repeat-containing protein [Streptomyces turgidiscabies]|uniref:YD repeat-containing protein n=1 Tax=Streptomyces turgidiscabies TaxID=85558 RepID=A0ABU0RUH6_9ACTN|nr:DNRLRE domain-containing protein [Streptomyces turgidiscabies]MDQ0934817.1 YD repeat-containing protein [Streptomyces turgidiscabies]
MARLQGRKIEVLSERTADSTTYALPSGELQTDAFAGPVRVEQDGVWKDIDTSLSDTGASLTPEVTAADITVSDGGDTALASVSKGKTSFGMGWEDKLPTPTVKDNTASYDLGDGQKLTVSALAQGFSQNVILDQAPDSAVSYRIPMHLDGLKLSQADSGHLLLKDSGGKLVAEAPAPMMWDSSRNDSSGEPEHQAQVTSTVETATDGAQTLVLTPDADFLADPDLTYPVTVDPTTTLAVTTDTWIQTPDYPDSQISSQELKSGTYDAGADKARSYMKFDVSKFAGKHITDTDFALYSYYSSTCATNGSGTTVRRITSTWTSADLTWAGRPDSTGTGAVNNLVPRGYSSACPAGWSTWDIDAIVQAWADGAPNYGVMVYGTDENDSTTWRRFRSANYTTSGYAPKLTVTYNSYPATPSSVAIAPSQVNGVRYVTSLTPTLSAKVTDPDGSSTRGQFEVSANPAYADTTYSYTATSAAVASGSTAKLTVPSASALPAGKHLRYRVRAYDGTDYGSWSSYTAFTMDTSLPAAPTISCDPYTAGTWTPTATGGATCTLDTTSSDGRGFAWGLDDPLVPQRVYDTVDGNGGDPLTVAITPANGWHTLYVRTIDSAGNFSAATTSYTFGVGDGGVGISLPRDGAWTTSTVPLAASGDSSFTGLTWRYRRGSADIWHPLPTGDVTYASDKTAVSAWPVALSSGSAPKLLWSMQGSLDEDGTVQLQALFTNGSSTMGSDPVSVTLDSDGASAPQQEIGPGTANLLTGDFTVSDTDATVFDTVASRTFSSRSVDADTDGQAAIFGPGWISSVATTSGIDYTKVRRTSDTSVSVMKADGSTIAFVLGSAQTWTPQPGAENLSLSGLLADATLTLTDSGTGTVSTFYQVPGTAAWMLKTSRKLTGDSTTSVVSEAVPGTTQARPKYLVSPNSSLDTDNSTCSGSPLTAGCRVLEFVYATATTATTSALGNYAGQVVQLKVWLTDPGASAATATVVAQYAYDSSGMLRQAWDPRLSEQKNSYTYDSAKRLATYTPAGQLPWTLVYSTASGSTPAGMLLSASRPTLAQGSVSTTNGTATTSVVYDVPLSGTSAPYQMGSSAVAAWGQTDLPTHATAIFPADQVPASHSGTDLSSGAYKRAGITYLDEDINIVNTAEPGGHISTSEFDSDGNEIRSLSAANRELALGVTTTGDPLLAATLAKVRADATTPAEGTAQAALLLSGTTRYTTGRNGVPLTSEESGPLHTVTLQKKLAGATADADLPAGSPVLARLHSVYRYDENRPSDAAVADLLTSSTSGAFVDGYPADGDPLTTATTYNWSTGLSLNEISDPDGLAITTVAGYDSSGRLARSSQPASSGSDAGTTLTTYWTGPGSGNCSGHREWNGLVCQTTAAGDVTGGGSNPSKLATKAYTYGRWGQVVTTTETTNGTTRTTTNSYDSAGRLDGTSVTGGVGTSVPASAVTYDSAGLTTTVTSNGMTITSSVDQLGRQISYNDGTGNITSIGYDSLNRPVKTTNSVPSTTTLVYDTDKDPRGVLTSETDSVAGTFSATYDGDGSLVSETLPGNYTLALGYDPTGAAISRVYTDSSLTTVLSDEASYTVTGQTASHTQTDGPTVRSSYGYDAVGHLTQAQDETGDSCATRVYAFGDANSNRTGLQSTVTDAACGGTADETTTASTAYTYDSADRLFSATTGSTTAKPVYDPFGRTTTATDGSVTDYYVNDLVHRQTSGTSRQTWTLDTAGRLATAVTEVQAANSTWSTTATTTDHYTGDADTPAWSSRTSGGTTTLTRIVPSLDSGLGATTDASGSIVLQLSNLTATSAFSSRSAPPHPLCSITTSTASPAATRPPPATAGSAPPHGPPTRPPATSGWGYASTTRPPGRFSSPIPSRAEGPTPTATARETRSTAPTQQAPSTTG